jgi:uncharacterized protein
MKKFVILDTSPLISLLNSSDRFHRWTVNQMSNILPPFLTCEPVITEACFLATRSGINPDAVLELQENGFMKIEMTLHKEINAIRILMNKYANVPMSLADACLVRLAELHSHSTIMTLDSDFKIYRIHKNQPIQLIMPN